MCVLHFCQNAIILVRTRTICGPSPLRVMGGARKGTRKDKVSTKK